MQLYITFGDLAAEALAAGFNEEQNFNAPILVIKDNFYIGPLTTLDDNLDWQNRLAWWNQQLGEYQTNPLSEEEYAHDRNIVTHIIEHCNQSDDHTATIWMGQNANDVCGYFWLVSQLAAYQGKIKVIYLNNLPFINEKGGIFYPTHLTQILPAEFIKALKIERAVSLSEFEVDGDEWKSLTQQENEYRILDGAKKIISQPNTLFDNEIIKFCEQPLKIGKVISTLLPKLKNFPSDVFIVGRIYSLINEGKIALTKPAKQYKEREITAVKA
jgi:hypothetical protein